MTCKVCGHINEYTALRCNNCSSSLLESASESLKGTSKSKTAYKKTGLFSSIVNREDAEKMAKDCGQGFFVLAIIQGAVALLFAPFMLIDAVLLAVGGYFVAYKQSRVAAICMLILSLVGLVLTTLNKMGHDLGGGNNIILSLIFTYAAIRAVEATFKLDRESKIVS
ncbi:hypothetical protein [Methylotenera sp. N17]|uniref:hypothetical protein n=1 Tax=Methylotenera sp. N17 TaxID=1502761 RepID=UPI0012698951|nr:hypothetical protein [Methylotenera sp. N17]